MTPIKSLLPVAKWILRFAAIAIIYTEGQINTAISFSFKGFPYLIALTYTLLTILLLIGAFPKSSKLTVISSLLLVIVCLVDLIAFTGFSVPNLLSILPLTSIGFYFLAQGNS